VKAHALAKMPGHDKKRTLRLLNVACKRLSLFNPVDAGLLNDACESAEAMHLEMKTPDKKLISLRERRCAVRAWSCGRKRGALDDFCLSEHIKCEGNIPSRPKKAKKAPRSKKTKKRKKATDPFGRRAPTLR